jgi:hypothetical protein
MFIKKTKTRKYHTVGTVPISNKKKIYQTDGTVPISNKKKIYQTDGTVPISNKKKHTTLTEQFQNLRDRL